MHRRLVITGLLLVLVAGFGGSAVAQVTEDSARARALRDVHGPDGSGKDGPLSKAGVDLLTLYYRHQQAADTVGPERSGLRVADGRVVIDAIAAAGPEQLRADLEGVGMTETAVAGRVVSGRLPIEQIPAAARLESLRGLMASRPQTRTTAPSSPTPPDKPVQPPRLSSQNDSTGGVGDTSGRAGLLLMGGMLLLLFLEEC